jgi:nucleoside-diphosphate-sugar epimerase/uncharacterized membrane protein
MSPRRNVQTSGPDTASGADARGGTGRGVIVVTGSSGFLGRALMDKLADRYDVIGLDFELPLTPAASIEAVRVDLTSDASVAAAIGRIQTVHGKRIASVIHLAGYYDLSGDPSPKYEEVTVLGTRRLLDALQNLEVEQFLFASTMLVHAPTAPGKKIDEKSPLRPKTPYPQSKLRTEELIANRHGKIPVVILRLAGVYDERCHAAFLAHQIANIFERDFVSYVYPGDTNSGQPYLHIDDLGEAVDRIVERRDSLPGEMTLLLGEAETMSYEALQKEIGRLVHGEDWETRQIPKALAKAGQWLQEDVLDEDPFIQPWMIDQASDHYELDVTRAKEVLDWSPRRNLKRTLPAMISALKADPPGWYATNKLNPAPVAAADSVLERGKARAERQTADALPRVEEDLRDRHRRTRWAHLANIAFGAWLVASPFSYGLFDTVVSAVVPPAVGHDLPAPEMRNLWLGLSEIASGVIIIVFSVLALARARSWAQWVTAAVGVWLLFAPIIFWTTSPAAYAIDTLLGMLVIVFAVMVPAQPGISRRALASSGDLPLGWTYSPSSYVQRIPIVALAFVGFFISRYLAAYQLGHVDSAWDPFFDGTAGRGNGTETVITSAISRSFPIADAGFGAVAYALDILTGAIGDRRRWRTMPWLVLIFGLLIIPLGFVSVGFIIIQPPIIGALCTLCLAQAAVTIVLIPYSIDEVLATLQFLFQSRRAGRSFWATLLYGGPALDEKQDRAADVGSFGTVVRGFLSGGVTYPWTLVASVAIGIWLIAAPLLAISAPPLAWSDHIAGCLVITIAVTAMAEVARAARFLNIPIGLWLVASPLILPGADTAAIIGDIVAGLALILLSLPRGKLSGAHYGSWDRMIV